MEKELNKIKENLYSRQIGTYGEEAMQKIIYLNILILGMKGLGVEIAKNIILTGPNSVYIFDKDIAKFKDLGSNYYLNNNDINKNRIDYSCLKSLSKLNQFTKVEVLNINESENILENLNKYHFDVIVQTEIQSKNEAIRLDEYCRKKSIKFIYGAALGLSGFIFSDFGNEHIIFDQNGIEPQKYCCQDINNANKGLITIVKEFENPLRLETGDFIIFKNIKGMNELNDGKPRKIIINDNFSFFIEDDTTKFHKFEGNGDIYEYKKPINSSYLSLKKSIDLAFNRISLEENFTEQDENKLNKNKLYLSIILAIQNYLNNKNNKVIIEEEIEEIISESESLFNSIIKNDIKIGFTYEDYQEDEIQNYDKNIALNIIRFSNYQIIPICSIIGGYISQEIIKTTGKYNPLNQWFFFDLYDHNFKYGQINDNLNKNNRYYDQISIFGDNIQNKLQNLNIFISGAGAVGCELLKNIALIGASTNNNSLLTIADYDNIEISNLNRQFLFNNNHIGKSKSIIACNEIIKLNSNLRCKGINRKIGKESENIFNEEFWKNQDIIISAVDNDEAREFLHSKCHKYNKIFMNVGTSGVRAKADIIIPKISYPFQLEQEDDHKEYPMCTIKFYPSKIEHCIEWSRSLFYELFGETIKIFNEFLLNIDEYIKKMLIDANDIFREKYIKIKNIFDILNSENEEIKINKIIELAIQYFYILFIKSISNLLLIYPPDKYENGTLFWSGLRKKPSPLSKIDINDEMTRQFLYSFCYIFSRCLGISFNNSNFDNNKLIFNIENVYKTIKINSDDFKKNKKLDLIKEINQIKKIINSNFNMNFKLKEEIFDKDNITNNHIEFIQSCSNLRARNYNIGEVNKNKVLMISGNIIASVPTSTSSVSGYICLEIINLMYSKDIKNVIKNAYFNLGLNEFDTISQEEIDEQKEIEEYNKTKNNYPNIEVKGSKTCKDFLEFMKNNFDLDIFQFEINEKILYNKRVSKNPLIIKREIEKSNKKIEELYFSQIKNSENYLEEYNKKEFMIKIYCKSKNKVTNEIEEIFNFPLIKYLIN